MADLTDDHLCSGQQGPSTNRPRIRSTTSCYKPNCEQLKSESNFLKSKDVRSTIAMIGGGERKGRVWGREGLERKDGGPLHYIVVAIGAFCLKSATAQCLCIRHRMGKSGPALGGTEYRLMPSACRLIVRAKLWNLQFRYLVSRAPIRRRSIVVV